MQEHVRLQLSREQESHGARIAGADRAGVDGALEIGSEQFESAPRRRFSRGRVERNHERGLARAHVHLHGDGGADHRLDERHELFGEMPQNDARIFRAVSPGKLQQRLRQRNVARAHGLGEELLLRGEMSQDRRSGHAERAGDVGERRRVEAPLYEDVPGGLEDLLPVDARWSAHL